MFPSPNYTDIKFGIHSSAARYCWVTYTLFGFLSSLIGDTVILIASFHTNAFKINKLIVTVIQHIAITDIVISIFGSLPVLISSMANSWILGHVLCYVTVCITYTTYPAGTYLIAALATCKFLILRYPLRAASWAAKRAHQVCGLIWASSLTVSIINTWFKKDDMHFDYRIYICDHGFKTDGWRSTWTIIRIIHAFVPNIIIVLITIPTLKYLAAARKSAIRVRGNVPWQGALTVALTAIVYCISILPITVCHIVKTFVKEDTSSGVYINFYRISYFFMMINIMTNFYIYTLTIRSFRRFFLSKVRRVCPVCWKSSTSISPITSTLTAGKE